MDGTGGGCVWGRGEGGFGRYERIGWGTLSEMDLFELHSVEFAFPVPIKRTIFKN